MGRSVGRWGGGWGDGEVGGSVGKWVGGWMALVSRLPSLFFFWLLFRWLLSLLCFWDSHSEGLGSSSGSFLCVCLEFFLCWILFSFCCCSLKFVYGVCLSFFCLFVSRFVLDVSFAPLQFPPLLPLLASAPLPPPPPTLLRLSPHTTWPILFPAPAVGPVYFPRHLHLPPPPSPFFPPLPLTSIGSHPPSVPRRGAGANNITTCYCLMLLNVSRRVRHHRADQAHASHRCQRARVPGSVATG